MDIFTNQVPGPKVLSMPLVCDYLKTHTLSDLAKNHGVYARVDGYKFSVNYDQIEAKDADPLAQECRGLVLGTKDGRTPTDDEVIGETVILARPMDRFFNLGQGSCASVDFASDDTVIYEKLDGTLCIIYFDPRKQDPKSAPGNGGGRWCIATRSVCEANLLIDGVGDYTFASLFRDAFETVSGVDFDKRMENMPRCLTFCFELMTPYNTVVVKHSAKKVALLATRWNASGQEAPSDTLLEIASALRVPVAPSHRFNSSEAVVAFVNSREASEGKGVENEGVVVAQYLPETGKVLRCKIKSAAYLMASRVKSSIGASPRNLMELILLEQVDDVLPLLTDIQVAAVEAMRGDLRAYLHNFDLKLEKIKEEVEALGPMSDHNHRKSFARAVGMADLWMAPAMAIYEGKATGLHHWLTKQKDRTNDKSYPAGLLDVLCRMVKGYSTK